MPELPDVELARRDLERWLSGAKVLAAHCDDRRLTRSMSSRAFEDTLARGTCVGVARRGKWLRIDLKDGGRLFSHLGMTGSWECTAISAPAMRFERARIDVVRRGAKSSVRYLDSRRFGRLIATRDDTADWRELGPDPLADGIDLRRLAEEFAKRRRAVKEILMDQRILAGIGNILATEALWMAKVDPRSPSHAVPHEGVRAIVRGLRRTIAQELAERKANREADSGSFFIYGRAGGPCPRCRTQLESVVLGGRTSVFCSHCQKRYRQAPS